MACVYFVFLFLYYGDHLDLHVLTHSFPTRRSSDLSGPADFRAADSSVAVRQDYNIIILFGQGGGWGALLQVHEHSAVDEQRGAGDIGGQDRKSTRLNSSH